MAETLHSSTVLGVDQDMSVTCSAAVHVWYRLIDLVHLPLLDPGLDALIGSEFEHLGNRGSW